MKKDYSFYALLLALPFFAFLLFGYSFGQTGTYSGSPGDSGNTCTVCHFAGTDHSADPQLTTDIPPSGYVAGTTYQITVSLTSTAVKHGFQITAENNSNTKVGEFVANSNVQVSNSNHLATHTNASNMQNAWTFQWTAPASSEGDITFYVAINATNNNGLDSGDQVVTISETVSHTNLGISDNQKIEFSVYPNPTTNFIIVEAELSLIQDTEVTILNSIGQAIYKTNLNTHSNKIDVSNLDKGVYFIQVKSKDKLGSSQFIKR